VDLRYDDGQLIADPGDGKASTRISDGRGACRTFRVMGMRERAKRWAGQLTVWSGPTSGVRSRAEHRHAAALRDPCLNVAFLVRKKCPGKRAGEHEHQPVRRIWRSMISLSARESAGLVAIQSDMTLGREAANGLEELHRSVFTVEDVMDTSGDCFFYRLVRLASVVSLFLPPFRPHLSAPCLSTCVCVFVTPPV